MDRIYNYLLLLISLSNANGVQLEYFNFNKETSQVIEGQAENLTSSRLIITGAEVLLPYEEYTGIPEDAKASLTSFQLRYLQMEPNFLVASLEGCDLLESISIDNVEWKGEFSSRVILPSLRRVTIQVYDINAKTSEEFFKHIFFLNAAAEDNGMVPRNVSINIICKVKMKQLYYNSERSMLTVHYFPYDISKYFYCVRIDYFQSNYELGNLNMTSTTSLRIKSIKVISESELVILQNAINLRSLTIVIDFKTQLKNFHQVNFNVSKFKQLSHLELENVRVWASDILELKQLETLKLENSEFNCDSGIGNVSELSLVNVTFLNWSLEEFLHVCFNLSDITLSYDYVHNPELKRFDMINFANSKNSLSTLHLSGFQLFASAPINFEGLSSLFLYECSEFPKTDSSFPLSQVFRDIKDLYLRNIPYSLFSDFVRNTSVKRVELYQYDKSRSSELHEFLLDSTVTLFENTIYIFRANQSLTGWTSTPGCSGEGSNPFQNSSLRDTLLRIYVLVLSLCCLFGIIGNCLTGIVLTRKTMRSSTSCIMLCLTLTDTIILASYAGSLLYFGIKLMVVFLKFNIPEADYRVLSFEVTKESLQTLDNFYYFLIYPLNKTAYTGSVYFTVLLTVERYLAVCWPFHVKRFLGLGKTICISVMIFLLSISFNIPRWIEAEQSDTIFYYEEEQIATQNCFDSWRYLQIHRVASGSGFLRYRYYRQYYHGLIWITLMYVLPITSLTILNFLIWKKLRVASHNRSTLRQLSQDREDEEFARITKMLLCVITIFVICNFISGVVVWSLVSFGEADPADVEVVSCISLILNSSVNFIIYCLMGQRFRNELLRLLPKWLISMNSSRTLGSIRTSTIQTITENITSDAEGCTETRL